MVTDPNDSASTPAEPPAVDDSDLVRLASNLARCGGWSLDVTRGDMYWTAEVFALLGYEPTGGPPPYEVAIGMYPDGYRQTLEAALERCLTEGEPIDLESVIIERGGRELTARIRAEAVRGENGVIERIRGVFQDVTEIVTERENRIAAQESLRTTLDYIPDVVCFVDESWRLSFANQATISMTNMTPERLASETIWQLFPELSSKTLRPVYEQAMGERVGGTARDYIAQLDRWVEATAHPIEGGIAIFARDVTDDEMARGERERLERRLETTLNQIQDGLVFFDREWRYTYLNETAEKYLQSSAESLLGAVMWEAYPGSYDSEFGALYRRAMDDRQTGSVRAYYPDLQTWFESTAYPTEEGIAVYLRDVSDDEARRQQTAEIAAQTEAQAALLDVSNEAMIMEDLENTVTYWNRGAEQIYGWSREEAVGRNIRELIYSDSTPFEAPAAALLRDGRWSGEMVQRTKDGRTVIIECRWQAVLDESGAPVTLFAVNSDVTLLRRQQELQSRAQRMESLGTLAGGIAHDLNNVLTPLLMSVQLMRGQQTSAEHEQMLEGMEVGVKRGADMIRQVLSFARGVDGVRDEVDLTEVVRELTSLTLNTLPKSIEVDVDIVRPLRFVGDQTQILQVLLNLVANARDAMESGGRLTITVDEHTIAEVDPTLTTLTPGTYALIAVEDSGDGMTQAVLDKIFEPFFTTKELGRGTGLGLASSIAIVRSHGGTITAYSELGTGSRFMVYLPLSHEAEAAQPTPTQQNPVPVGSGELVLVVDDEASIRRLVTLTLEAHGYRVVEASNGRQAIEVFTEHADDVALLLTDMMMPVMDGAATAAYFFEHHPHVAIVAASGLNANGGVARATNSGVRYFVAKPFTTETLLRTVHAALHD